ncbi:hypothetical protein DSM112329_03343 [Paraconexibacter sp. AEG42_29]|uniref:Uncharacterized protein n=1 Tax=Paraconexibacter sp. AEG42_29 TaxID=2997339 RepID=A0AAU7AXT4_9ACTN
MRTPHVAALIAAAAAFAVPVAAASAQTAPITITGPASVVEGTTNAYQITVDPSGAPTDGTNVQLDVFDLATPCPASPQFVSGSPSGTLPIDPAAGPRTIPFTRNYDKRFDEFDRSAKRRYICAYLEQNTVSSTPFATGSTTIDVQPSPFLIRKSQTTMGYGYNKTKKKCVLSPYVVVAGRVTDDAKTVAIQKKVGTKFVTVKTVKLDGNHRGTLFVTPKKGTTYRAVFLGTSQISGSTSATHKLKPISNRC